VAIFVFLIFIVLIGVLVSRRRSVLLNDKLQAALEEVELANVYLKHARVEADKASQIKSEFIAYICHELRSLSPFLFIYCFFSHFDFATN
jgi:hypothetical protein